MARALAKRVLRSTLLTTALLLGVALAAGLVRLLPWMLAPHVPLQVALPFARLLAIHALEAAVLVGPPLGFALGASLAVELGEARALFALGASPARLAAGALPVAAVVVGVAMAVSGFLSARTEKPGRFAADLVAQGRASCGGAEHAHAAEVPLVGVTWLCFPDAPPRVVGALPPTAGLAWFSAADLTPNDDLTEFGVRDLRVRSRATESVPAVSLHAASGTVRGLSAWGARRDLPAVPRAAVLMASSLLLAFGAGWIGLASARSRPVTLAAALVPPLAVFALASTLDRRGAPSASYVALPLVAAVASITAGAALRPGRPRVARRPPR